MNDERAGSGRGGLGWAALGAIALLLLATGVIVSRKLDSRGDATELSASQSPDSAEVDSPAATPTRSEVSPSSEPRPRPTQSPVRIVANTPAPAPSSVTEAGADEASIREGIAGVGEIETRMATLDARLHDAGVPTSIAEATRRSVLMTEAALRFSQLEAGDPTWSSRLADFRTARDSLEHDTTLGEDARAAALESLRHRAFGERDLERGRAAEALDRLVGRRAADQ